MSWAGKPVWLHEYQKCHLALFIDGWSNTNRSLPLARHEVQCRLFTSAASPCGAWDNMASESFLAGHEAHHAELVPPHHLHAVPGATQSCGWPLQDMKHSMESMSQRIISPWNSLLTAVLPFLPKLHDKRPQGMSRVSDESSSSF